MILWGLHYGYTGTTLFRPPTFYPRSRGFEEPVCTLRTQRQLRESGFRVSGLGNGNIPPTPILLVKGPCTTVYSSALSINMGALNPEPCMCLQCLLSQAKRHDPGGAINIFHHEDDLAGLAEFWPGAYGFGFRVWGFLEGLGSGDVGFVRTSGSFSIVCWPVVSTSRSCPTPTLSPEP